MTAFLVTQFVLNFVTGLGRVGNLLVHVRCVEREDKALGMAVQVLLTAEVLSRALHLLLLGGLPGAVCLHPGRDHVRLPGGLGLLSLVPARLWQHRQLSQLRPAGPAHQVVRHRRRRLRPRRALRRPRLAWSQESPDLLNKHLEKTFCFIFM